MRREAELYDQIHDDDLDAAQLLAHSLLIHTWEYVHSV